MSAETLPAQADIPAQPQEGVNPSPLGRLPLPAWAITELDEDLRHVLTYWATRLSGVATDLDSMTTESAQSLLLAQITANEALWEWANAQRPILARVARHLGVTDLKIGEASGVTEEAARRRRHRK